MIKKNYFKIVNRINRFKKFLKFKKDFKAFISLDSFERFKINKYELRPMLNDASVKTNFDAHYIYHPAWAARVLKRISPVMHVDFSSTLHFSTIISAFIKTEFYDFRPASITLDGLKCEKANLINLEFDSNSIESLSCLHTIEHIGLGRYGDELDPNGDIKAINELQRVASDHILIVVPIGEPKIIFNAHRIYDPRQIVKMFNQCRLVDFAFVDDYGVFKHTDLIEDAICQKYACGCFYFRKNR
jgi:hypothetical protein